MYATASHGDSKGRMTNKSFDRFTVHDIVEIPITLNGIDWFGVRLPVVVLSDGQIFGEALSYTLVRLKQNESPSTLRKINDAIGLFFDYYVLVHQSAVLNAQQLPWLLRQFGNARFYGCKELNWKPVSYLTADLDVGHLTRFYNFCVQEFEHEPINPEAPVH
jgi:hypothetical protein